ncbi:MAG: hypothetical protein V1820_04270 [archaeon]
MASKKGQGRTSQGALEYLITYGWAILIIVIIGGALFALGIFNPSTWGSNKRATGFSSLQVSDWKLNTTGLTILVGNRFGDAITITNLSASRTGATGDCQYNVSSAVQLSSDGTSTLPTTSNVTDCLGTLTTGKSYTLTASIYFTAGGLTHVDTGTITGKME